MRQDLDKAIAVPQAGFPLMGRFFVKLCGKAFARVGAGVAWMWGGGPCGRPAVEVRPVSSPLQQGLEAHGSRTQTPVEAQRVSCPPHRVSCPPDRAPTRGPAPHHSSHAPTRSLLRFSRFRRILLALGLSVFLLCCWLTPVSQQPAALAHAFVIGSDPVDGSTVSSPPRAVRIFFDATISPASNVYVYTPDERIVNAARSSISTTNPRELDTPLMPPDQLPQGSYTVRWTALASVDGHTTHGVIGFNIGRSSAGLPGETILGPSTSNILPGLDLIGILAVAWEWLELMALTFWVGILVTEGLILNRVELNADLFVRTKKQARPLQWLCLSALLVGEVITLILRTAQLTQLLRGGGIDLADMGQILTRTDYGYLWFVRVALILAALGLLWWTTRQLDSPGGTRQARQPGKRFRQMREQVTQEQGSAKAEAIEEESTTAVAAPSQRYSVVWLLLAGLILFTLALSGDTAALAQPHISAIVLDWLYLSARCIWLGSLAYLGYVLLSLLTVGEADHNAGILTKLLRRFQPLMLGALGVFLVSGLYLAEGSLSNIRQLIDDPYGRTLLVECILIAIMILLSAYALFMLPPKLARQAALLPVVDAEMPARRARQSALEQTIRRLKQALRVQSWLGAGILFCAALMAFFAPPIVFPAINYAQNQAPTTPATQIMQTKQVGNLSITLEVLPGRVNYANTVIVTMKDTTSGKLITDAQVQVFTNMEVMDMGIGHATIKGGNPTYIATFSRDTAFSMPGAWDITLKIQRPNQAPLQATFTVILSDS